MVRLLLFLLFLAVGFSSCSDKPSKEEISQKILMDYVCGEKAKVNNLQILRTEETESTGGLHLFRFSVRGEVEWKQGCNEASTNTPPGTKEKFERLVTLYKTENGTWE